MAIHNKSHHNHALMSLNKMRKDNTLKHKTATDFTTPDKTMLCLNIMDCLHDLKAGMAVQGSSFGEVNGLFV